MVLLVERLHKLYNKLENHHHHHHHHHYEALSASLQVFRSDVLNYVNQLSSNSKHGSESLSLSWIHQFFQLLPLINKAFAKLVVEIDYPMSRWKEKLIEEYLKYSLDLLDLLNSISSSLSHLGQSRILMSYALSLLEGSPSSGIERLKEVEFKINRQDFKIQENKEDGKEMFPYDEEWIVHQAFLDLKYIGLWVCFLALAALTADEKAFFQMRKSEGMSSNPLLINLDSIISGAMSKKGIELKEIQELKEAADHLAAAVASGESSRGPAEEMQRRLEVFEKELDGLGKEVDSIFSQVLAGRSELLDGIRHQNRNV